MWIITFKTIRRTQRRETEVQTQHRCWVGKSHLSKGCGEGTLVPCLVGGCHAHGSGTQCTVFYVPFSLLWFCPTHFQCSFPLSEGIAVLWSVFDKDRQEKLGGDKLLLWTSSLSCNNWMYILCGTGTLRLHNKGRSVCLWCLGCLLCCECNAAHNRLLCWGG